MSLEQLYLEQKFDEIRDKLSSSTDSSSSLKETVESIIFKALIATSDEVEHHSAAVKTLLDKFIDDDEDYTTRLPRSSFFRLLASLAFIKSNFIKTTNNNHFVIAPLVPILQSFELFSSIAAEAQEMSKRDPLIHHIYHREILEKFLRPNFQKWCPELKIFLSGAAVKDLFSVSNNKNDTSGIEKLFAKELFSSTASQHLQNQKQHDETISSDFSINRENVEIDSASLGFKTKKKITAGDVVLVDKFYPIPVGSRTTSTTATSSSSSSSLSFQNLSFNLLKKFEGSFPHFFNALCDITEPEDEDCEEDQQRTKTKTQIIVEKFEAVSRIRDQFSDQQLDLPGIVDEVSKWRRQYFAAKKKNQNVNDDDDDNEEEKETEDKTIINPHQLRLEALAQFLFCRCAVPLIHPGSSIMDLEGDGLQFSSNAVPSLRKVFGPEPPPPTMMQQVQPDGTVIAVPVERKEQEQEQDSEKQRENVSVISSSTTKVISDFLDETNQLLSDFHQPRVLFPLLCYVPHSCMPNCVALVVSSKSQFLATTTKNNKTSSSSSSSSSVVEVVDDGDESENENRRDSERYLIIIALKDIPKNTNITISRLGNFAPPLVRGSFCGGVASSRATVIKKKIVDTNAEANKNKNTNDDPIEYTACEFCNGPIGDLLEIIVCPRCKMGCVPVDVPTSARAQHGKYAKCCGFCTVLIRMDKLQKDVVDHSEMAVQFLVTQNTTNVSSSSSSSSSQTYKAVRILHAVLKGLPLVTGNHHLRLRLCLEIITAVTQHSSSGSVASFEDVEKAKEACLILQDTIDKFVPILSPLRPALWMAHVRVLGISARFQYHEIAEKLKIDFAKSSSQKNSSSFTPPPFNVTFLREQCPKEFAEARDKVSYAFETHSIVYSSMRKYFGKITVNSESFEGTEIIENFLECFSEELASCGVHEFKDVVEMMRM